MCPTDAPDFLHFCDWKNVFCLQGSSLNFKFQVYYTFTFRTFSIDPYSQNRLANQGG